MRRVFAAVCGLLLLSGCGAESPRPTATPLPAASAPSPADGYPEPDPDYMRAVVARLGPVPTSASFTPEQEAVALAAEADTRWGWVLMRFPGLVRPETAVVHVADDDDDYVASIAPCFEALGVPVDYTYGNRGYGINGTEPQSYLDAYRCETEYPARPHPPLTPTQLAYLYDYFVQFKAPCLTDHGYDLAPPATPPEKEAFVAQWPRPGYNPTPDRIFDAEMVAVELACPPFPEGLR